MVQLLNHKIVVGSVNKVLEQVPWEQAQWQKLISKNKGMERELRLKMRLDF